MSLITSVTMVNNFITKYKELESEKYDIANIVDNTSAVDNCSIYDWDNFSINIDGTYSSTPNIVISCYNNSILDKQFIVPYFSLIELAEKQDNNMRTRESIRDELRSCMDKKHEIEYEILLYKTFGNKDDISDTLTNIGTPEYMSVIDDIYLTLNKRYQNNIIELTTLNKQIELLKERLDNLN